jgi:site-specific recombinase XerD
VFYLNVSLPYFQYFYHFINHIKSKNLSKSTIAAYQNALEQFKNWVNIANDIVKKDLKPEEISPAHINSFKQYLISSNKKPNTVNKQLATLSAFFTWAVENELVKVNPVSSVKNVKNDSDSLKWLTDKQIKALQSVLINQDNPRNNLVIKLILYAGMLVNELSYLKVTDIEKTDEFIYLRVGDRKIPAYKPLRWALLNYLNSNSLTNGYLLSSVRSEQLSIRAIQHIVAEYGKKAGIENLTAITLRHTFGYKLAQAGADPYTIAILMGYKTSGNFPNANTALQYITDWGKFQKQLEKNIKITFENLVF